MEQDRRGLNRLPVPRVLVKISTPERMRVAYLKDLSEGGVFIRTDKPLAVERVVDIDLLAPGRSEPLRLRGRIARVQNDEASRVANLQGMGVKFIEVTPQQDAALKALVVEYQSRPATPTPSPVPDSNTVALKQALETADVLRATLIEREEELKSEHDRRQDLSVRVLALTKELEGVRTRGSDGQGIALDALKVELGATRAEALELKARLEQAEGNVASMREELKVLEEDDASTRRLAETLAQQKAKQETELKRLREEAASHSTAIEQERGSAFARSAETTRLFELEKARSRELEERIEELAATNATLTSRATELEGAHDQARKQITGLGASVGELAAAKGRITTLEQALNDEKQKSERLKARERELRALVAAISAKGDDVVVMDDGVASPEIVSNVPSAGVPQAVSQGLDPWEPGQTLVMMTMPTAEEELEAQAPPPPSIASVAPASPPRAIAPAAVPPPAPSPVPVPAIAVQPAPLQIDNVPDFDFSAPPVPEEPEDVPMDVEVDVDSDWGGQALAIAVNPAPGQQQFLDRLRANDKLVRNTSFFDYSATDSEEEKVFGTLMGADRFEDLKVLSRGACTPEHLESFLLRFHQLGLIGFS